MTITHHTKMDENVTLERETQDDVSHKESDSNSDNNSKDSSIEVSSEDQPKEEWQDILGNGQLKKKVIKKGEKGVCPHRSDICTVKIVGVLDDGTVVEEYDDMSIQTGDLEVVQGLDLTLVLMELGEVAEVVVNPRFAYGTSGTRSVPSEATITYTVELKGIEYEPEIETISIKQRREIGNKKRERGNWWFIRKDLSFAIQCYRRALEYLQINDGRRLNENEETKPVTDTELQALLDDCIKVYNNLAAALIETEAYDSALENVDIVLKHQPKNIKALYRKGKILKIKGEYGKAYMTFLEAQKLEPELKSVQIELMSLKEKISKQSEKEKNLYAKMLGINKDADKLSKTIKVEEKSKIAKGILWTLLGASAAVVGILVHRFTS